MESLEQKKARVVNIIAVLKKTHPDAKLALDFTNPLELLIALILAAQCRDDLVNTVTPPLFRKYKTAAEWSKADPATLQEEIHKITFFRNKTKSIIKATTCLVKNYGGKVPDNLEDLLEIPGVGRKTGNVLLGNAYGVEAIGVDRHVARVSERLGLTKNEDPDKIEEDLTPIVPDKDKVKFCHLLQFHGRRICVARVPKCPECPINPLCFYPNKTKPGEDEPQSHRNVRLAKGTEKKK
jgi:endonuclease III